MTPYEFLTTLWPETGYYALATPFRLPNSDKTTYAHKVFTNVQDAVTFVERSKHRNDIFFCVNSLAEPKVWNPKKRDLKTGEMGAYEVRTQTNMLASRCFFFDLDVGDDPKKYPSQAAALADLIRFCKEAALPKPMITSSGGGLHVYWPLTKELPSDEWRQHAVRLKALAKHHGLRADPMRTTDAASVLRVAGTFNLKDPENPRKVRVLQAQTHIETSKMLERIAHAMIRAGETPQPIDTMGKRTISDDDLGSNTERTYDGPPVSVNALGKACGQFRRYARARGDVSEPEWFVWLQLLRHTENGHEWAHKLSAGHPSYDRDATDQKLHHLESKDVGPSLCSTIADRCGAELCAACPHFGAVKSPLVAARNKDIAPAPVVMPALPSMPQVQLPDPPQPFKRLKSGGIGMEIKNSSGNEVTIVVYENDLYPIRRIIDRERRIEQQMWRVHLPRGVTHDFVIDAAALYKTDMLATQLANNGVYPRPSRMKEVQEYMSAYISELQKLQDANASYTALGWHDEFQSFVLPDKVLKRDGTVLPSQLSTHAESATQALTKAGTLAKQIELLEFYNHPAYVPNQVMILGSFAAPLFHMTGHSGVVCNATGEAGASKSTTLYTAASIWANPTKYPLNGTNHGATQKARAQRMTTMGSLPVCVDEITTMNYRDAQELVMNVTQPEGRLGLNRDGKERRQSEHEKSTIMLTTANNSLHSLLSHENSAGTAGSMRVFEIRFKAGLVHKKHEADYYMMQLRENYGHAGEFYMAHVVRDYDRIMARLRDVMRELDERFNIQSSERFWSAYAAAIIVAGEETRRIALVKYPLEPIHQWLEHQQFPTMRGIVIAEYATPLGTLSDYLETISSNIIVMDRRQGSQPFILRAPSGQLLGHYDVSEKTLHVLKKGFKDYCIRVGADSTKILDELHFAQPDARGHTTRVISQKNIKKVLGAGTEFAKAQSWCFTINMAHPEVTGVADLSVVSGDSQATTPARGQMKII